VHTLAVLALAAAFAAPPEATRDLAAADRLDRLGLRLERLAPGLRRLGLTRTQADRLVTTAELVL
jgi:hypothetical protein